MAEQNWPCLITSTGQPPVIKFDSAQANYTRSGSRANLMLTAVWAVDLAAGSGLYLATMPPGLSIDPNNCIFDDGATYNGTYLGSGRIANQSGTLFGILSIKAYTKDLLCATVMFSTGTSGYWNSVFVPFT